MKILITGGSGFLGTAIRDKLIDYEVSIVKRKAANNKITLLSNESLIEIDWPGEISNLPLENFDYLFYLSHEPVTEEMTDLEIEKINLKPLADFIECIVTRNLQTRIIFISSQSVTTNSKYGRLKKLSEDLIISSNINALIVRPGLIFGKSKTGLFNSIVSLIKLSPIIPMLGDNKKVIQPLFIDDFVRVILKILGISQNKKLEDKLKIIELSDSKISFHDF